MIIGLVGTNASGKDTIGDYLIKKGFKFFSCSDIIRDECKDKGLSIERHNLIEQGNYLRETFGPSILAKRIIENAKKNNISNISIGSVRNPFEILEIKRNGGFILAIDAPIELRYKRIQARKRESDFVSFEKFKKEEEREMQSKDENSQQLQKCIDLADFKIMNDSTLENLFNAVDNILDKLNLEKSKEHNNLTKNNSENNKTIIKSNEESSKCSYLNCETCNNNNNNPSNKDINSLISEIKKEDEFDKLQKEMNNENINCKSDSLNQQTNNDDNIKKEDNNNNNLNNNIMNDGHNKDCIYKSDSKDDKTTIDKKEIEEKASIHCQKNESNNETDIQDLPHNWMVKKNPSFDLNSKRISKDEYFLKLAMVVAERSTCLRHHVGAVAVKEGHILGTGFNGTLSNFPHCLELGCIRNDYNIPSGTRTEICRAVHAEQNVIVQCALHGKSLKDATFYCTHSPCVLCAKLLTNAKIKKFVTYSNYPDPTFLKIFEQAGIEFVVLKKPNQEINELP